jgi:DNA-binding transcriptional LysR family regulator
MLGLLRIKPGRLLYFHSREAIREAVALGIGVSLMYASECPPDERLVDLPPDAQPDATYLSGFVVCRVEQRKSAMMRWVYDAAATLQAPSTAILPSAGSSVKKASMPAAM